VTLVAFVTSFPSQTKTSTLTVTVTDPCLTTTLQVPAPLPINDMTSVKVLNADGTKLVFTQLVSPFFDSVSVTHGSGTDVCGARSYSISSQILSTATASLTTDELYINAITGLV
jgi:hypothetical protein